MASPDFASRYGPWALVTGAAQGLGAAFCAELAARGSKVLALDRDSEPLAALVEGLRASGAQAEALELDLADDDIVAQVLAALGTRELGLLVNNAATSVALPFFEQDLDALRARQRINCEAPLLLAHALGERMLARKRGGLLFVSSLSMVYGGPLIAHYAATKAFDAVLAEGLFEELRGSGIDVSTVLAPLMDTPGLRATQPTGRMGRALRVERVAREALDALGQRARLSVGRDGMLLTGLLARLFPRALARRIVANNVRAMYPEPAARL